jgi:hypothetical protein
VDSIVTTIKVSVCDNELPYNHSEDTESNLYNLSQTGTYRDTLTSILSGCDSVVKLELTVYPTYKTTDTIRICDNDENPYIWQPQDHNSKQEIAIPFSVDMSTNVTNKETVICRDSIMLESIFGCDSLVYLYLEVNPTYKFVQQDTVCQDTINKYWTWHDKQGGVHDSIDISKSGTFIYGDTLKTTKQCDSIFGVELFVKPIYRFDSIYTICQNERIDWQGRGYTGSKYGRKSKYISKQIINDRGDTIAIHSDSIYYEYENGFEWSENFRGSCNYMIGFLDIERPYFEAYDTGCALYGDPFGLCSVDMKYSEKELKLIGTGGKGGKIDIGTFDLETKEFKAK